LKSKGKIILIILVVVIGTYLVYGQMASSISPYLSVSDVTRNPEKYKSEQLQIIGIIKDGSLQNLGTEIRFLLTDNTSSIQIFYSGSFPSGLQEGREVVVVGVLTTDHDVKADKILVKCPSRYEEQPRGT